ncbi:MAG: hypothetical protein ABFD59_07855, partial [Smithella sp.]
QQSVWPARRKIRMAGEQSFQDKKLSAHPTGKSLLFSHQAQHGKDQKIFDLETSQRNLSGK